MIYGMWRSTTWQVTISTIPMDWRYKTYNKRRKTKPTPQLKNSQLCKSVKGSSGKILEQKERREKRNWRRPMERNVPIRRKFRTTKRKTEKKKPFHLERSPPCPLKRIQPWVFLAAALSCLLLPKFFLFLLLLSYVKMGCVMHKTYIEKERERVQRRKAVVRLFLSPTNRT